MGREKKTLTTLHPAVHNAVTTALQPEATLFPESMGLKNKRFNIPAGSKQQCTPEPETRNPKPETRNPKFETRNPKPETRHPTPENAQPKTETLPPEAQCEPLFPKPGLR